MHPVKFHLRNKLTWMSRQLRSMNKAAEVMDWVSAMHSVHNLLVDVSGKTQLFQDCSLARNHITKSSCSEKRYWKINRSVQPIIKGLAPETNIAAGTPKKRKRILLDQAKGSSLSKETPQKVTSSIERARSDNSSSRDMNFDVDDEEDRFAKSLPLPSLPTTPNTRNSILARDQSGDDNENYSKEHTTCNTMRSTESDQRNLDNDSKQLVPGKRIWHSINPQDRRQRVWTFHKIPRSDEYEILQKHTSKNTFTVKLLRTGATYKVRINLSK